MDHPILIEEQHGSVLLLQLNSPGNRNAIGAEMKDALWRGAKRFVESEELRCLLITGCEGVFCAGGDLRSMRTDTRTVAVRQRMALTHASIKLLVNCEKPVITAVNGAAVGAGLSLALLGDIAIAREDAYFMAGFPKVGVLPDMGVLYTLPRAVGRMQANDLLMTNRRVEPQEAKAIGLVSRVLPAAGFLEAALQLAQQVAEGPPVSIGLGKALAAGAMKDSFDEFLQKESIAQAVVFGTEDFAEGQTAFVEKRRPRFRGR
ncbi:MAG: enoyl-CoA hydratase/isomerase family protein [Variovorax sp.]|nr:enoyl-CoA hydratase/isomerase family protein [Variovorax sp.]